MLLSTMAEHDVFCFIAVAASVNVQLARTARCAGLASRGDTRALATKREESMLKRDRYYPSVRKLNEDNRAWP